MAEEVQDRQSDENDDKENLNRIDWWVEDEEKEEEEEG